MGEEVGAQEGDLVGGVIVVLSKAGTGEQRGEVAQVEGVCRVEDVDAFEVTVVVGNKALRR